MLFKSHNSHFFYCSYMDSEIRLTIQLKENEYYLDAEKDYFKCLYTAKEARKKTKLDSTILK